MLFAPVPGRADQDREAALRAGSERQGNGRAGRQGQGHRQPRAETGTVVRVQRERILPPVPAAAAEDRTWDNGTEASCHTLVDESLGMPAYFADPYSSWQRGTNENRNGRIRRYLPKKPPFDDLTQAELDAIVKETDDTPMKHLEYKTPNEAWDEETSRLQSKTTNPSTSVALTS